jgi:hypothetical protein
VAQLETLFKTTINRYGSRVRILSDHSILLDNPTVLIPEISPKARDYFCISLGTVRSHFSKQNVLNAELVNVEKPPWKLFGWLHQKPAETMKVCYWRKPGKAIRLTVKKIRYLVNDFPKQDQKFDNVEFIISIDEPEKMIEKMKELGFAVK